ncbi:XkdX family protein (plasmid) [Staphylococcus aureus]|nr:XkdX family protein [Staphylococcus aureus]UXV48987.1 XkdX family protein [Staphylococcus aureus]UXV54424.1 XkdX family protein [Staphylococcus aureus]UXV57097.1 XkdX family protein [Staphylococcus aureus]
MWFKHLKYLYDRGHYPSEQFKVFVKAKWITEDEFFQITGEQYQEES